MAHELQDKFSTLVDEKLRTMIISPYLFNNKYEGDPVAGAIKIPTRGEAEVQEYNRSSGIKLTEGDTTYVVLSQFKDLAINEIIDGYEADAVPDDIIADRLESAAYSLALRIDKEAFKVLETEGTKQALKADAAYEMLVEARTALSKKNVPTTGRVAAITPEFYAELLLDDRFIRQGDLAQEIKETGAIGQAAGFTIYETNLISTKDAKFIANHPNWSTQATTWAKDVYLADLNQSAQFVGASAVKGRKVVGHKVTNKDTVIIGTKSATA